MSRWSWARRKGGRIGSPEIYELRRNCVTYAIVQKLSEDRWFSYGLADFCSWNTTATPMTLDIAKADALSRARDALEKERGDGS